MDHGAHGLARRVPLPALPAGTPAGAQNMARRAGERAPSPASLCGCARAALQQGGGLGHAAPARQSMAATCPPCTPPPTPHTHIRHCVSPHPPTHGCMPSVPAAPHACSLHLWHSSDFTEYQTEVATARHVAFCRSRSRSRSRSPGRGRGGGISSRPQFITEFTNAAPAGGAGSGGGPGGGGALLPWQQAQQKKPAFDRCGRAIRRQRALGGRTPAQRVPCCLAFDST